jgi:ParB-like chromosome segregation protein Spo0J
MTLATVPVIVRQIDNPLEAERVLIESNRQREKTVTETMHEAEHIARIIAEENRRKMLAGKGDNPVATLQQGSAWERRKGDGGCWRGCQLTLPQHWGRV